MKSTITVALALVSVLAVSPNAAAQQSDALRCLDSVKPVIRNEDGSLSPNPAFDACLRNPIVSTRVARPAVNAPSVQPAQMPAQVSPTGIPAARQWSVVSNELVETSIRGWLPPGWQLKWDTKAQPRSAAMQVSGDFLDAVRALARSRRQWMGADGSLLQITVFKADRIVQVRDANADTEQGAPSTPAIRTEPLSGAPR